MATNASSPPHRLAPALVLLLLGFVWGSSFILMKIGLFARDGSALLPPVDLAALRVAIAGATLLPVSLRHLRRIPRDRWRWIAGVGIIGSFIPALLFAMAQVNLPSAMAGMLNALSPLWTLIIGFAAFGTAVQPRQIIGILVGLLGTAWLIWAQAGAADPGAALGGEVLTPALMLVVATVCYGISGDQILNSLSVQFPIYGDDGHYPRNIAFVIAFGLLMRLNYAGLVFTLTKDVSRKAPDSILTTPSASCTAVSDE